MLTEWLPIASFPGYSVSDTGLVRNDDADRLMTLMVNQFGTVHVGLTKNRIQHKRSVSLLVARAFLVPPRHQTFDTAIQLDGDRYNNRADNLVWRPKHFAVKYGAQFKVEPQLPIMPVAEVNTGQEFESSWDAAITYGLLDLGVRQSARDGSEVWPTYQRFTRI